MKLLQKIFFLFSFTLLTACGGDPLGEGESSNSSSGNGTSTGGGTTTPTEVVKTVTIAIDNNYISAANPAVVTATVTENGDGVSGEIVTFSAGLGEFDVESKTALTNNDGVATIGLTAGSTAGAALVTASIDNGETDSVGFETAGDQVSKIVLDLSVVEPNSTNEINVINTNAPGQIVANVIGVTEPVIVSFRSDIGVIPISTAITDENNQAIVDIYAGDKLGAGTITASLNTGEQGQQLIVVGATNLYMGSENIDVNADPMVGVGQAQLSIDPAELDAGSTMSVSVKIVDENNIPYGQPIEVNFSSDCSTAGNSILNSPVTSINGIATSTYRADGCIGEDTIIVSANVGGVSLSATVVVDVQQAATGSIEFVEALPEQISLKGVGGTETSTVKFKVLDVNGNPVSGETVLFDLNTKVGGLTLSPEEAETDDQGFVQTVVNAGTIATSVRVTASVVDGSFSTQSSQLVVSTGIPDQDSFSLSVENHNIEGWSIDGVETKVSVRLADAFNNPVPDDTVVTFTTEGGSIEPSCLTRDGHCKVVFTTQNPRPADGRVTILATAIGEESFRDLNGDGWFNNEFDTSAEVTTFRTDSITARASSADLIPDVNMSEAFLDSNENGVYDQGERFIDFNNDGVFEDVSDVAEPTYTGSLCTHPNNTATCDENNSINVRMSAVIVFSGSSGNINPVVVGDWEWDETEAGLWNDNVLEMTEGESTEIVVQIFDANGQQMPVGTKVNFDTGSSLVKFLTQSDFTWPDSNSPEIRTFSVTIVANEVKEPKDEVITITVDSPNGESVYYPIRIKIDPAPESE